MRAASWACAGEDICNAIAVAIVDANSNATGKGFCVGHGPGGGSPHIKVFNGVNLNLIDSYFAGSTNDPYGVYIN